MYNKVRLNTQEYCKSAFFCLKLSLDKRFIFVRIQNIFPFAITMHPSTRYHQSLRSGSVKMTRKYPVPWEICVTGRHLIKKASSASLNFAKSTARFWKPSRKCTRVFVVSTGSSLNCFRLPVYNA